MAKRRIRKKLKTDGNMPIIIVPVSSRIIDNAVKADSHHCMIADAVKIRVPKAQYISVDLQSIRFTDPDTGVRLKYFTPLVGQQALVKFDQGKNVKPFTLTLKDGVREPAGWAMQNGGRKPSHRRGVKRKYTRTGRKRVGLAKKERKFGLRNLE